MLRVAQVAQRKPALAELLDKILARNRAMHGVFGDSPKLRDDCGRTREKERFHSPAHLVPEFTLVDRADTYPPQAFASGRNITCPTFA